MYIFCWYWTDFICLVTAQISYCSNWLIKSTNMSQKIIYTYMKILTKGKHLNFKIKKTSWKLTSFHRRHQCWCQTWLVWKDPCASWKHWQKEESERRFPSAQINTSADVRRETLTFLKTSSQSPTAPSGPSSHSPPETTQTRLFNMPHATRHSLTYSWMIRPKITWRHISSFQSIRYNSDINMNNIYLFISWQFLWVFKNN